MDAQQMMELGNLFNLAQHDRLLRLHFVGDAAGLKDLLLPFRLCYEAALSAPYRAALTCLSPVPDLALKQLLGRAVQIQMDHSAGTRVVNGHVDSVRQLGTNGGITCYLLNIAPGLALLSRRRTSRIFQELSVPDIVARILQEHVQGNSALASMLHLEQCLRRPYAPRSYCTQFDETDLDFIHRLLAEEGISYCLRFSASHDTPTQTVFLFDDGMDLDAASPRLLAYRSGHDGQQANSLLSWQPDRCLVSSATTVRTHDYKPAHARQARDTSAVQQGTTATTLGLTLEDYQVMAPYAAADNAGLQQRAQVRQMGQDQASKQWYGTTRCLGPETGHYLEVGHHPALSFRAVADREFVVTHQHLTVYNNLPHDVSERLPDALMAAFAPPIEPSPPLAALPSDSAPNATYARFAGVRRGTALVPTRVADLRRPTARGPQTATVVGRAGEIVDTDAMGRILIQMHWSREEEHPDGGAAFDHRSSTRVRCALPSAGDGSGHQFLPRVGDEVVVVFLHDDIDRPLVMGAVHGGRRPPPAFSAAGALPGNRTLSGIHTREHHGEHVGELLFDDTPGQPRARLATSYASSALNLGYLTHPRRDGQASPRGEGAELRTDGTASVRGARGLLLTTEAQPGASGSQLQRDDLIRGLGNTHDLLSALSEAAQAQSLDAADAASLHTLLAHLRQWEQGSNAQPEGNQGGAPIAALHAGAGLAVHTSGAATIASGTTLDLAADHLQHSARRHWRAHAGEALTLFAQGARRAMAALRIVAARGDVEIAAHDGRLHASATGQVHLEAGTATVISVADGPVRILGGGGCLLQMDGGNIDLHCPGTFRVKASATEMEPGAHASVAQNQWPQTDYNERFQARLDTGEAAAHCRYELIRADGARLHGTADANGMIELQQGVSLEEVIVRLLPTPQEPR